MTAIQAQSTTAHRSQVGARLVLIAIIALWLYGWAGTLVLTLQTGRYVDESLGAVVRSSPISETIIDASVALATLALVAAAALTIRALGSTPIPHLLALLAPWVVLYPLFLITRDMHFGLRDILFPLFMVTICFAQPSIEQLGRLIANIATITAGSSILMGIFASSVALMPSWWNVDKAIIGDSSLAGLYGHSNQLGTILALSVPFVVCIYKRSGRNIRLAIIIAALIWSSSRSSLITVLAFFVIFFLATAQRRSRNPNIVIGAVFVAAVAAVLLPPFADDPETFTDRGKIWQACLDYWSRHIWAGGGPDILHVTNNLTRFIGGRVNTAHNVWLTFATAGGIIALVTMITAIAVVISRSIVLFRSGEPLPLSFALTLVILSIAEDPVRVLHLGPQSFIVWSGLALAFCIPRHSDPSSEEGSASMKTARV